MPEGTAILNGFGRSLGDGIIGLQALNVALDRGAVAAPVTLFRLPGLAPMLSRLYDAATDFAAVAELPLDAAGVGAAFPPALAYPSRLDLRDFAFDADFRAVAMIDFFLCRLGLNPRAVPPALCRNTWLAPRVAVAAPNLAPGYVLVCPRASMPLRDMPAEIHAAILAQLAQCGRPTVTQGPNALPGQHRMPPADSLGALCGWVANASLVVSTDTAMIHLADAFGVPCLGFFVTHRPEWRARDYPLCRPLYLPARELPESLEFARDDADLAAARAAWFPNGRDLAWLDGALGAALEFAAPG